MGLSCCAPMCRPCDVIPCSKRMDHWELMLPRHIRSNTSTVTMLLPRTTCKGMRACEQLHAVIC